MSILLSKPKNYKTRSGYLSAIGATAIFSGNFIIARGLHESIPPMSLNFWRVGIFASLLAYVLWNKAVLTIGPSKTSMIYYTLPVFSGFLAYFLLHEDISMIHFYSVLLIISGIFITNYQSN